MYVEKSDKKNYPIKIVEDDEDTTIELTVNAAKKLYKQLGIVLNSIKGNN